MKLSTEGILTTHTGSLPRPAGPAAALLAEGRGDGAAALAVRDGVQDVVRNLDACRTDIANLKVAIAGTGVADAFLTAASPGVIALFLEDQHYPSHEAYLFALADAMNRVRRDPPGRVRAAAGLP